MNLSRIMCRIRYTILPCVAIEFPLESSWATTGMKGQRSLNHFPNREVLWFETLREATILLSSKPKGSGIQK